MNPPAPRFRRWRFLAALVSAIMAGITGCLVIPVDYHAAGSRHNVSAASTNSLQVGVTTRAEVLLALGEPDHASEDERRLGFAWSKVKALVFVGGPGGGAGGEVVRSYILETTFDADNRLAQVRLLKAWGEAVQPQQEVR